MAWPSTVNTSNVDNGTDTGANARADIKAAIDALNTLIGSRGAADGFPTRNSAGQTIFDTNFFAQLVSGNATFQLSSGDKLWWNDTTNRLYVNVGGTDFEVITNSSGGIALSQIATQAANTIVANATGGTAAPTAVGVGGGLIFSGGSLVINTSFLASLITMPFCGFATTVYNQGDTSYDIVVESNSAPYTLWNSTAYEHEIIDTHNGCSAFAYTVQTGQAGDYFFKCVASVSSGNLTLAIYKNGTNVIQGAANAAAVSGTLTGLAVGDVIKIYYTGFGAGVVCHMAGFAGYRVN
jgi:hypothetical protein